MSPPSLPTLVIGGYLGAGKTTLVNHLLRHAQGRRLAVMVNDFGEIGIDADLIVSQDGAVMNLAGGCVCCSVGSDLMGALMELGQRTPAPDLVIIETSGVALPAGVARSARLAPGIALHGVIVLVDAESVQARARDVYVGDTVLQQLREADLLLVNKLDLVTPAALAQLQGWLAEQAPRAPQLPTRESAIELQVLLDVAQDASPRTRGPLSALVADPADSLAPSRTVLAGLAAGATSTAATIFDSVSVRLSAPVPARTLADRLLALEPPLVRIKGIVRDPEQGVLTVQAVGPRLRIEPATEQAAAGLLGGGQLVAIGLAGQLDRAAVLRAVNSANESQPESPPHGK